MKNLILLTFLVLSSFVAMSQKLSNEDIIGNWTVVTSVVIIDTSEVHLDTEERKKIEDASRGFRNAEFRFNSDKSFDLFFAKEAPQIIKEFDLHGEIKWKIDIKKNVLLIGKEVNNYNHLEISLRKKSGKTLFILAETPFVLIVEKL